MAQRQGHLRKAIFVANDLSELNALLDDGWEVLSETPVEQGALVILERDGHRPLVTLN